MPVGPRFHPVDQDSANRIPWACRADRIGIEGVNNGIPHGVMLKPDIRPLPCVAAIMALEISVTSGRVQAARRKMVGGQGVRVERSVRCAVLPSVSTIRTPNESSGFDADEEPSGINGIDGDVANAVRFWSWREAPGCCGR
jgi:hypothetical protein